MADKTIGELPSISALQDDSLIPVEQQGVASKLTGKQFADFARESAAADVQRAVDAASTAGQKASEAAASAAAASGSASAAANSAAYAAQEANGAAASRRAVEDMGVEAVTLSPGSEATVSKTVDTSGAVTLNFGIPRGDTGQQGATGPQGPQGVRGEKGEKGDTGESGIMSPVAGFYALYVDDDGNLWAVYPTEDATPAFEYDSDTGDLYCVIGG